MNLITLSPAAAFNYTTGCFYRMPPAQTLLLSSNQTIYLRFETPVMPSGLDLAGAVLRLYPLSAGHAAGFRLCILDTPFPASGNFQTTPVLTCDDCVPFGSIGGQWTEIDLTPAVRAWCSGAAPNGGLLLFGAQNAPGVCFASDWYPDAALRPVLVLTYCDARKTNGLSRVPCTVQLIRPVQTGQ